MTIWIHNPFQEFEVGWDWAQHVAAGYQGGTDYIMYPPDTLRAAADGHVTLASGVNGFTPGSAVILALGDGRFVNYREVAHPVGKFPRNVKRDDVIGMPTQGGRWPHVDATVGGVRVPFEPLVNIGLDPAGGGTVTPIYNPTEDDMYYNPSTPSSDGRIQPGELYKQSGDGPLVQLTNLETFIVNGSGAFIAPIGGDDLNIIGAIYGLAEVTPLVGTGPLWGTGTALAPHGNLTGRRQYQPTDPWVYPNTAQPKPGTVDVAALATALAPLIGHTDPTALATAVTTALAPQFAAIKFPTHITQTGTLS